MRKIFFIFLFLSISFSSAIAQNNSDRVLILPFENTSGKPEFNWVGESFADSLSDLLKVPSLNVVSNEERKIIQQRLGVPLTNLPSLATSLRLAREARATLLIAGKYNIVPAQGETAASLSIVARIIRVNEGRFLNEELPDGRRITRDINLKDALANLQTIEGQLTFQILYQRDKNLPFAQKYFLEAANKVPARAFEAYIKGLLTSESEAQTRENYFKNAMRLYAEAKPEETYTDAALELGHLYLNQRQNQNAVDYFGRVIESVTKCQEEAKRENKVPQCKDESFAEAAFYTGLIYWAQENYEQALAVLRPLADDLKLTSVYNTLGAIAVQAARAEKNNKGKSAALLTEGIEFLKSATEVFKNSEKPLEPTPDETIARFNYGVALFLNNNFAEAVQQLQSVAEKNQRDGEAYFLLAKAFEGIGDTAKAKDADDKSRRLLTENNKYAKLETDWKNSHLKDVVNLRVEQPPRKDFVSVVLIKNKTAVQTQMPINETEALLDEADKLYKAGRDDEAMGILRRVLVSEPMSGKAYLLLGNIHLRRGDLEQAVSSLRTALFWDNRLIKAHVGLGRIFLEKKDCLAAQSYMRAALEIARELNVEEPDAIALQRLVERCK